MKKFFTLFILLIPAIAFADNRKESDARKIAVGFFQNANTQKVGRSHVQAKAAEQVELDLVWTDKQIATRSGNGSPTLYVYAEKNGGFVIVSGDDYAKPILAYSLDGQFCAEGMPDNIKTWLASYSYAIEIASLKGKHLGLTRKTSVSFPTFLTRSGEDAIKYETALWDQTYPYNKMCPANTVTGCTNTAMAIIMRYFKWPIRGEGTLPDYSYQSYARKGHELGHTYDWENMPLKYTEGEFTDEQANQVAQLMYDIGIMNHAEYIPYEDTGTDMAYIEMNAPKYMLYSDNAELISSESYGSDTWVSMLKTALEDGPVEMGARLRGQNEGGHAFVVDGYSQEYFSFNFGWSGKANGYYTLVPVEGLEDKLVDYSNHQYFIRGLKPDYSKASDLEIQPGSILLHNWDFNSSKSEFNVNSSALFKNSSKQSAGFDLCLAISNKTGIKETLYSVSGFSIEGGKTASIVKSIRCSSNRIALGDRISWFYRMPENNRWFELISGRNSYISFNAENTIESSTSVDYDLDSRTLMVNTTKDNSVIVKDKGGNRVNDGEYFTGNTSVFFTRPSEFIIEIRNMQSSYSFIVDVID